MSTIVYYYSYKGSNRYLATKIATDLKCEIEEIKPILNSHLLMIMGLNFGNRRLKTKVENFDKVILCGPIWMGKLIVPLKNFMNKHIRNINKMVFVTCCGSTFKNKDEKFGHNFVFNDVKNLAGEKCIHCEAFPIGMVLPDEHKEDTDAFMKTHLNDENFKGEIAGIYDDFILKLKSS